MLIHLPYAVGATRQARESHFEGHEGSPLLNFNCHSDSLTATQTERGNTALKSTILQRVDQRCQHARTARTQWMSQCDRATVDVDLVPVPALVGECISIRKHLRSKSLIEFDQIHIFQSPANFI